MKPFDKENYEPSKPQSATRLDDSNTPAHNVLSNNDPYAQTEQAATDIYEKATEKISEAYDKTTEKVGEAYDKTTEKVGATYEKAKNYSNDNPGKSIFIALGIGVGLGLLLGASSHHRSRTSRIAEPVVNALSDVALAFFR